MLTKIHETIRSSDLRKNLARYLKKAGGAPVVISTDRGGDSRVMISSAAYNKLVETYEDYLDSRELARLVKDGSGKRVSLGEMRKKYGV
jgi:PHD/YefM family antitoxin component YafN of YafNO toxin-antitoxin module